MHARVFWLPKAGNADHEYEDAFALDPDHGRFAIADGAAASSYARPWAQMLVDGFVQAPAFLPRGWGRRLPSLQQQWLDAVGDQPRPWYAEMKVKEGAFATFLGLGVRQSWRPGMLRWKAIAVGDSCLVHVREGRLLEAFPLSCSAEFDAFPWLIGSRSPFADVLAEQRFRTRRGRCRPDDRFCLMTDALAQWFLHEHEAGGTPWQVLEPLLAAPAGADRFGPLVADLRVSRGLRNDDVTLVVISLGQDP